MKNILITGGAGFIGSNLSLSLIEKGYNVSVLDNLSPQIHGIDPENTSALYNSIKNKVMLYIGSITDSNLLKKALLGQNIVVHLAAETGTGQSMYQIEHYNRTNVLGTALLLDLLAKNRHEIKKLIVASSRAIYGEGKYHSDKLGFVYPKHRRAEDMDRGNFEVTYDGIPGPLTLVATDEDSTIHPSSVYGITKHTQEQLVMTVSPTINISPVAFRYQNVYGPGQSLSNPYTGILSIFSTLLRNGKDLNIFEDGLESRDFVFIDDVVKATIAGIENEEANNQIFNVGSGVATDVITIAKTLKRIYNSSNNINVSGNYRVGDIRHNFADLTKIKHLLGYTPSICFEEGIATFSQWVSSQKMVADTYNKSISEMQEKGLFK